MLSFVLYCASALLVQTVSSSCVNNGYYGSYINSSPLIAPRENCGCGGVGIIEGGLGGSLGGVSFGNIASQLASSNGGSFVVSSSSPLAPGSVSVVSDNLVLEGPLTVFGQVPFVSAVNLEGLLPSGGYASAAYSCGNGEISILDENLGAIAGSNGIVSSGLPLGYGSAGISSYGLSNVGLNGFGLGSSCRGTGGLNYGGCGCH